MGFDKFKQGILKKIYFLSFFIVIVVGLEIVIRELTGLPSISEIAQNIIIIFLIGLLLLFSTRVFKIFLLLFIFISLSSQICHAMFYGGWIEPVNLLLLFNNLSEVINIIPDLDKAILFKSIILIVISLTFVIFLYIFTKKTKGFYWVNALVILLFIFQPIRDGIFKPNKIEKRFTKNNHGLLRTSHNSFGVVFSMLLSKAIGNQLYPDYRMSSYGRIDIQEDMPNIYIYYGESLSSKYMSLYGYDKKTTPLMENIVKNQNLYILSKETISGAIATMTSTVRFFHLLQKPDARRQASSFDTSLFRYAKELGYNTSYVSTQAENYISHIYKLAAGKFSDIYYSPPLLDDKKGSRDEMNDKEIFKTLDTLDLKEPFFSVFQPNGSHPPFNEKTTKEFKKFGLDSELAKYENTVFQTDYVIDKLISKISKISKNRDWIFVMTSDHGTFVDDTHITRSLEYPASYTVPGMIITNSKKIYDKYLLPLKKCQYLFHRNISETIGRVMGFDIPNKGCNKGVLFSGFLSGFNAVNVSIAKDGNVHRKPYIK